jgi:hypothetical protein
LTFLGGMEAEPDKSATATKLRLVYQWAGPTGNASPTQRTVDLFIKASGERKVSLFTKAITAAFTPEPHETAFHARVTQGRLVVPVTVAPTLAAYSSRLFLRNLLVQELVGPHFQTVADWRGASAKQLGDLVSAAARMHARYWRLPGDSHGRELSFLYEDAGLQWLGLVDLVLNAKTPAHIMETWRGLKKYFATEKRLTMSHGDCRPGNMLFRVARNPEGVAFPDASVDVVFTDWEAACISPFMWDFTYATLLGQEAAERRSNHAALLSKYRASLVAAGVPAEDCPVELCEQHRRLLVFVVGYFGIALNALGGIGVVQGNTNQDMVAWRRRVIEACREALEHVAEMSRLTGVPESHFHAIVARDVEEEVERLLTPAPQ